MEIIVFANLEDLNWAVFNDSSKLIFVFF